MGICAVDQAQLVYDVGVHRGEDTEYYLHKGFRVVGVEANPLLVEELRKKFAAEILDGRLTIVHAGISTACGEAEFWICDDISEWSSFHREIAARDGARHHSIRIPTIKFESLLEQYGTPHYLKIDIEGNDDLCVHALSAWNKPKYLSYEMPLRDGIRDLSFLKEIGYTRFKIVSQVTRTQPFAPVSLIAAQLPNRFRNKLHKTIRRWRGLDKDGAWRFAFGSSGGFGGLTPGPWRSHKSAVRTWTFLHRLNENYALNGLGDWYDVHATW
jgi:FkbM family methyltransferase